MKSKNQGVLMPAVLFGQTHHSPGFEIHWDRGKLRPASQCVSFCTRPQPFTDFLTELVHLEGVMASPLSHPWTVPLVTISRHLSSFLKRRPFYNPFWVLQDWTHQSDISRLPSFSPPLLSPSSSNMYIDRVVVCALQRTFAQAFPSGSAFLKTCVFPT